MSSDLANKLPRPLHRYIYIPTLFLIASVNSIGSYSCQTLDANGGNFSCIVSWTQLYMVFQLHIVLSCTWVSAGQGSGFSSIRNMFFFYLFSSLYIQCIQHYSTAINSIILFS